jgi:hypothetical protein
VSQPPYAENGTYGGVGGLTGAIPSARPDLGWCGLGLSVPGVSERPPKGRVAQAEGGSKEKRRLRPAPSPQSKRLVPGSGAMEFRPGGGLRPLAL